MGSTKKVKSAGRYGSRYGIGIRRRILKVEEKQKKSAQCLFCGLKKVKREAAGIFYCRKCKTRFAGGAYFPQTLTGSIVAKMVSQKSFLSSMTALVEATETSKHQTDSLETKEKIQAEKKK